MTVSLGTSSFLIFAVTVFTFVDQDNQVMRESEVSSDCFMATELALAGGHVNSVFSVIYVVVSY